MKRDNETINMVAGIEKIKGIPTGGWTSVESFLKASEGLLIFDEDGKIVGEIGEVFVVDGTIKGVKLNDVKLS